MIRRLDARGEGGFTIVELMMVIAVFTIVIAVAGGAIINSLDQQRRQMGQVHALNDAKIAFERVTRDLRGAHRLLEATDRRVEIEITRLGEVRSAVYEAVPGGEAGLFELIAVETVRDQATGAPLFPPRSYVVHDRLLLDADEPVFTFVTDDDGTVVAVEVALRILPATGTQEIALRNEVGMRNVTP